MGSTFGGFGVAASGMNSARAQTETAANNIANASTDGYTRQRVNVAGSPELARTGLFVNPNDTTSGQGSRVISVQRLGSELLEARLRTATGEDSYNTTIQKAMSTLELSLNEPSNTSISSNMQKFWSSWQDLANNPADAPSASTLLGKGKTLAQDIASGYNEVSGQWDTQRSQANAWVDQLNTYATQLAEVNVKINEQYVTGGNANELLDSRDGIALKLSELAGGQTLIRANGTAEVTIGGNQLVAGDVANKVSLTGAPNIAGASSDPVRLVWTDRPNTPITVRSGNLGAAIDVLGPVNDIGTGGTLAEAARAYNNLATELATQVNTIHQGGQTATGTTGLNFFGSSSATAPAALSLTVIPTNAGEIASGAVGAGPKDGSTALKIGQIAFSGASPDKKIWSAFVSTVAVTAQSAISRSAASGVALQNALGAELSNASVDLTEENIHLITAQDQFEAAARVLTTLDEMLDTIINKTGTVGR